MRVPAKFVCDGCGADVRQACATGWSVVGVSDVDKNGDTHIFDEHAHLCPTCAAPFRKGLWFIDPERQVKR